MGEQLRNRKCGDEERCTECPGTKQKKRKCYGKGIGKSFTSSAMTKSKSVKTLVFA